MAAFLISLLFPIWDSPRFWVGFVIHPYIGVFQLTVTTSSISPYQVFGLYLGKAECLLGSWSNVGTYGTNIELYIFQGLLLSAFLYGVTSSKILMTFCFPFKDKYFLSFYMLHAAFQKHTGEFETPAVSFQDLFEDPWAMYSLFSSWVAAGSVLHADSKGTVSSLSVSPKSTWGWLVSCSYHGESMWHLCDCQWEKFPFLNPCEVGLHVKEQQGKTWAERQNTLLCNLQSEFG